MAEQKLTVPRLLDETVLRCFRDISHHFSDKQVQCSVQAQGYISYQEPFSGEEFSEISQVLIAQQSALIERITLTIGGFSCALYRGGQKEPKSPIYDEVAFTSNTQQHLNNDEKLWLVTTLSDQLKPFDPGREVSGTPTPEQQALHALHEQTLSRLELLNEKLIRETQNYREELDSKYLKRTATLEETISKEKENLESKYAAKHQGLDKQQEALNAQKKEFDDRSNTHARREIRKDILEEIKRRTETFQLTKNTRNLRLPIAISMIALIAGLGIGGIQTAIEFTHNIQTNNISILYSLGLRQIFFTFGAVGSLIYLIRWLNRWFEQHAQAEFQLKQFQLDIERASWIVETTLEWNDAKGTTMPDKLLESLSRNLFTDNSQVPEQAVHPADQLASALMGSASAVKLKAGESEISIDPKKLKKSSNTENKP